MDEKSWKRRLATLGPVIFFGLVYLFFRVYFG